MLLADVYTEAQKPEEVDRVKKLIEKSVHCLNLPAVAVELPLLLRSAPTLVGKS